MATELLTFKQETRIANAIKEIYFESIVENRFYDDSDFFHGIEDLVNQSIEKQNEAIKAVGGGALRYSDVEDLANAFWDKYKKCITTTEDFAYEINHYFGYSIDLACVVGPYFLYQVGVTDENISFYLSLGLVVAKIICDSLASKKEERDEKAEKDRIKIVCAELTQVLERAKNNAGGKERKSIEASIEEMKKIT